MSDLATSAVGIGRWIKDPFPALSHALGAILALVGMIVLLVLTWGTAWQMVAFGVYGTSMVLLYAASALTHSIHCSPKLSWRLDQLDYMAIFGLIAGTYTPICLGPLWGPWGITLLVVEWTLAVLGVLSVVIMRERAGWIRVGFYAVMGWLVLIAVVPLLQALPVAALLWLLAGGLCYTVGAVIFATERPRLWPGVFASHDLWHCLAGRERMSFCVDRDMDRMKTSDLFA